MENKTPLTLKVDMSVYKLLNQMGEMFISEILKNRKQIEELQAEVRKLRAQPEINQPA